MSCNHFRTIVLVGSMLASTCQIAVSRAADDPLEAFPTVELPVEERLKLLSESKLKAIQLPENGDELVLSIATVTPPDGDQKVEGEQKPWIRVFADGRIDGGSQIKTQTARSEDTLTDPELLWLLHLATSECQILWRTTDAIEADYRRQRPKSQKVEPQEYFEYQLKLPSGKNTLKVPAAALRLRMIRSRMKLGAFASLNKYAGYLVSRAFLGKPTERDVLIDQLNGALQQEEANLPPFHIEHLAGADVMPGIDLFAMFQQDIEIENNHFKEVVGMIRRVEEGAAPEYTIRTKVYQKYRPTQRVQ